MEIILGQKQKVLLDFLANEWIENGPNVCCLEGFSGVGKTEIARFFMDKIDKMGIPSVMVNNPYHGLSHLADLMLTLAPQ